MSLQGSLETFALPDVLVLLASTKKDGLLKVGGNQVDGKVWIDKGQIVQSTIGAKTMPAVDAVWELLRLESGSFSFEGDKAAPKPGNPEAIDLVLADAQTRLAEWRDIAKVVPHLDAVVDMAHDAPGDEVTVSSDQWKLLVAVAGGRTVRDLMERLGLEEFDTCRKVRDLVEYKLASIDASGKSSSAPVAKSSRAAAQPEPVAAPSPEADQPADSDVEVDLDAEEDMLNRPRKVRAVTSQQGSAPPPSPAPSREKAAAKSGSGERPAVDEAKALVAQLAALGGEDEEEVAQKVAAHLAEGGELPEVPNGDEPINRGLLLKFLSSVRN